MAIDSNLIRRCAIATGMTSREIIYIASTAPKRYKVYDIPKRNGGTRTICQPSRELKAVQYFFLNEILSQCQTHEAATAYEKGTSIADNAKVHANGRVVLKTDFKSFFPSIRVSDWKQFTKERFPEWSTDDVIFSSLVLFWGAGGATPVCLSIGAPTSPKVSNILMHAFDDGMSRYAASQGCVYTRYADDVTISSQGFLQFDETLGFMRELLRGLSYPKLRINDEKTGLFSRKNQLRVTGLVLSNDHRVSLGRDRKRKISSLVHKHSVGLLDEAQIKELSGLLAFAHDVEPEFIGRLRKKYGAEIVSRLQSI